jgi:hypothetical protein
MSFSNRTAKKRNHIIDQSTTKRIGYILISQIFSIHKEQFPKKTKRNIHSPLCDNIYIILSSMSLFVQCIFNQHHIHNH